MSITRNVLKTLAAAAGEKADNTGGRQREEEKDVPETELQAIHDRTPGMLKG